VTASLANFAYDPINWPHLLEAEALDVFLASLEGEGGEIGAVEGEPIPQNVPSGSEPLLNWISRLDFRGWLKLVLKGSTIVSL